MNKNQNAVTAPETAIVNDFSAIFAKFSKVVSPVFRRFLTCTGKLEDIAWLSSFRKEINFYEFAKIWLPKQSGTVLSRSYSEIDGVQIDFRTDSTIIKSRKINEKDAIKRLASLGTKIPEDYKSGKQSKMYSTLIDAMLVSLRSERKENKESDEYKDIVLIPEFIFSMEFDVIYRDFSEAEAFQLHAPLLIAERETWIENEKKEKTPNTQKIDLWEKEISELKNGIEMAEKISAEKETKTI